MKRIALALCLISSATAHAQLLTVEPDNYVDGTVLNTVMPGLSMITVGQDNLPYQPVSFDVTAATRTSPYLPPTGSKVFAHVGVPFWNDIRKLRMDFGGVVSSISIDFMGSTSSVSEQGRLEVYGTSGLLLGSYTTQPLFGGQIETMSLQHNSPDIAWAVAYTLPGQSVFGALDHLVFSQPVAVPEPGSVVLVALGLVALLIGSRRKR